MAANQVTSSTGTKSGTDPSFVVAQKIKPIDGAVLCIKYTQGTTVYVQLTFDVLNTSLHATDKYRYSALDGDSLKPYTMYIYTAGNYRVPLPVISGETTIYANVTFSGAGLDASAVVDVMVN